MAKSINSVPGGRIRRKNNNFSMIPNELIRDTTLSLKSKGLYCLINSYSTLNDFILYKGFLQSQCQEGKAAFEAAWKELKDAGYLKQYRLQDDKHRFYYEYELLDHPETESDDPDQNIAADNSEAEQMAETPVPENRDAGKKPVPDFPVPENWYDGFPATGKPGSYNNTIYNNTLNNNTDIDIYNHLSSISINEVMDQIGYDTFPYYYRQALNGLVSIIHEVYNLDDNAQVPIGGTRMPAGTVKAVYRKIRSKHIQEVCRSLATVRGVKNKKSYTLTTLYNSVSASELEYMFKGVQSCHS